MAKTSICLLMSASLAMLGAQAAHGRGCGGAHATGSASASGARGGSASGSHSYGGASTGRSGAAGGSYQRSYEGAHGGSYEASGTRGAAHGPGGAAAGGTRDASATGPEGRTYSSSTEHGAAATPYGAAAGGSRTTTATGAGGQQYSSQRYAAAGYSTTHAALPTDAGYAASATRTGSAAYAGYHQTEAVSGSVATARGAAVRSSYAGYDKYGAAWHAANPGAWSATGWAAGSAWKPATWTAVGTTMGWGATVQPVAYNYGSSITYQGSQVYYGNQPVATAEQYYQQASTLAQSAPPPDAKSAEWMPLGVFALVQKEQAEPHYIMQLAVDKSGAIAGNCSDQISGTNIPIQGAVDKKTQRAAWTVGTNKSTVCETGIYNLTQDEAPALIHVGKDKTQQWLLVRLKQRASPAPPK